MKKGILSKIGHKIDQNRAVKFVNKKLDVINKLFEVKGGMEMDIKHHKAVKKWSPMEIELLEKI